MASEFPKRSVRAAAFAVALALLPSAASADTSDAEVRRAARNLAREGVRRYDAGDFEGAREVFQRAYQLVQAPTIAVREARALVRLGRLVDAAEAYARAASWPLDASTPVAFRQAIVEAKQELADVRMRLPKILVTVVGVDRTSPQLALALDGQPVPASLVGVERALAPGPHVIEATLPGQHVVQTVTLGEGETRTVALRLTSSPAGGAERASPPDTEHGSAGIWPAVGWTAVGAGAVGVGVGVATALAAMEKKRTLDDECPSSACPASAADDLSTYRTLRTASIAGYVAGGVTLVTGVAILLAAPSARDPKRSAVVVHPGPETRVEWRF